MDQASFKGSAYTDCTACTGLLGPLQHTAQLQHVKEKKRSRVSSHAPYSSVRTSYTSAIEQYIREVAHHDGNHIHLYSFSPNT